MRNRKNRGLNNDSEAILITRLLNEFSIQYSGVQGISIGIISFYNNQVCLLHHYVLPLDLHHIKEAF